MLLIHQCRPEDHTIMSQVNPPTRRKQLRRIYCLHHSRRTLPIKKLPSMYGHLLALRSCLLKMLPTTWRHCLQCLLIRCSLVPGRPVWHQPLVGSSHVFFKNKLIIITTQFVLASHGLQSSIRLKAKIMLVQKPTVKAVPSALGPDDNCGATIPMLHQPPPTFGSEDCKQDFYIAYIHAPSLSLIVCKSLFDQNTHCQPYVFQHELACEYLGYISLY